MNPELLLLYLCHYGFSNYAQGLMKNFFNRQQSTKIDCNTSVLLLILLGVPQGSVLGPILFIIFINDQAYNLEVKLYSILFADDSRKHADFLLHLHVFYLLFMLK